MMRLLLAVLVSCVCVSPICGFLTSRTRGDLLLSQSQSESHSHSRSVSRVNANVETFVTGCGNPDDALVDAFCLKTGPSKNIAIPTDWKQWDIKAVWDTIEAKGWLGRESACHVPTDWTYEFNAVNKLTSKVSGKVKTKCGTDVQNGAHKAMDLLWAAQNQYDRKTDGSEIACSTLKNTRRDTEDESGHIIAASIGGSNSLPKNFFPQYRSFNRGGIWKRMEGLAMKLGNVGGCVVTVTVTLNYNTAGYNYNYWVPVGGKYLIESVGTSADCKPITTGLSEGLRGHITEGKLTAIAGRYEADWTNV